MTSILTIFHYLTDGDIISILNFSIAVTLLGGGGGVVFVACCVFLELAAKRFWNL